MLRLATQHRDENDDKLGRTELLPSLQRVANYQLGLPKTIDLQLLGLARQELDG